MNILCIYKDWARGETPWVADGVFSGRLTGYLFQNFETLQDIINEVNSPYFPTEIDKVVVNVTAKSVVHFSQERLEECETIIPKQQGLKEYWEEQATV